MSSGNYRQRERVSRHLAKAPPPPDPWAAFAARKKRWLAEHPHASTQKFQEAMQCLAKECGVRQPNALAALKHLHGRPPSHPSPSTAQTTAQAARSRITRE